MTDRMQTPHPTLRRPDAAARVALFIALSATLAACTGIGAAPPPRLYALGGSPAPAAPQACATAFSVREVRLAGHLDRSEIVVGRDGPEIQAVSDGLWAAPLRTELPRRLTSLLQERLGGSRVVPYPWRFNEWPELSLTFDVDRMEPQADGLRLLATWTATVPGTVPRPLGGGRFDATVPMADRSAPATVQAADTALGRLADAIVAQTSQGARLASVCAPGAGGGAPNPVSTR